MDTVRVVAIGDPAHRVGNVVVEAGKESEPVFAREPHPAACRRAGDTDRARLAAQRGRLVDVHLEAALGELVSDGKARHAAA